MAQIGMYYYVLSRLTAAIHERSQLSASEKHIVGETLIVRLAHLFDLSSGQSYSRSTSTI